MGEIHGVRALRLLANKPIAVTAQWVDLGQRTGNFLELEFDDHSIIDFELQKNIYDDIVAAFKNQGVGIEQHLEVRDRATVEGRHSKPAGAEPISLYATETEILSALARTVPPPTVTPGCAFCGKPVAYPGAKYCGAGCCARDEAHMPKPELLAPEPTMRDLDDPLWGESDDEITTGLEIDEEEGE